MIITLTFLLDSNILSAIKKRIYFKTIQRNFIYPKPCKETSFVSL